MSFELTVALGSVFLVLVMVAFADAGDMLSPKQMVKRYPVGFPLVANGTAWGELLVLPWAIFIIGKYREQWDDVSLWIAGGLGLLVSIGMHAAYRLGKYPDALAGGGRGISSAGYVHAVYFAAMFALVFLFFCFTKMPLYGESGSDANWDTLAVSGLLFVHLVLAHHVPLNFLNKRYRFVWCPNIFTEESAPLQRFWASIVLLIWLFLWKVAA